MMQENQQQIVLFELCGLSDRDSDGHEVVYVCRVWTLTYNVMFDQIESLNS